MTDEATPDIPKSFWVITGIALVWNLLGLMAFIMQMTASPEMMAESYDANELAYMNAIPGWATGAYGVAVIAGVLGCIALLLRKAWAKPLFVLSLAGILTQNAYGFLLADGIGTFGVGAIVLPIAVIVIAIGLVIYAGRATAEGWIK